MNFNKLEKFQDKKIAKNIYTPIKVGFPTNIFGIPSLAAMKIHLFPSIIGKKLSKPMTEAMGDIIDATFELGILKGAKVSDICVLNFLRGAIGYPYDTAFYQKTGLSLKSSFLGIERRFNGHRWETKRSYNQYDPINDDAIIIINDTIASGVSSSDGLTDLATKIRSRVKSIRKIIINSIATSWQGIIEINKTYQNILKYYWPDSEIYFFFTNALFGVVEGTHLSYANPETMVIPDPQTQFIIEDHPGLDELECCVFDWGDANFDVEAYCLDVIPKLEILIQQISQEKGGNNLENRIKNIKREKNKLESILKQHQQIL